MGPHASSSRVTQLEEAKSKKATGFFGSVTKTLEMTLYSVSALYRKHPVPFLVGAGPSNLSKLNLERFRRCIIFDFLFELGR